MAIKTLLLLPLLLIVAVANAQTDTIPGEADYLKHYDCLYRPGKILVIQKKGKTLPNDLPAKPSSAGFIIRMEAIYDLEFADKKRYKSSVVKNITNDSITLSSTYNEAAAKYEGIPYKMITYGIKDIRVARFISERSLGFFNKKKIDNDYDLIVKDVDKAKFCPYLLTFTKRNNEVKVCHYYLTAQGYDLLYETDGFVDYMDHQISERP